MTTFIKTQKRGLKELSNQLEKLDSIENYRFSQVFLKNKRGGLRFNNDIKLPKFGVYFFIFNNKKIIYIGTTTSRTRRLRQRIHDVFHESHTLFWSLKHDYGSKNKAKDFIYNKCSFSVLKTNKISEAKRLEMFSIAIFDPKYNQETK